MPEQIYLVIDNGGDKNSPILCAAPSQAAAQATALAELNLTAVVYQLNRDWTNEYLKNNDFNSVNELHYIVFSSNIEVKLTFGKFTDQSREMVERRRRIQTLCQYQDALYINCTSEITLAINNVMLVEYSGSIESELAQCSVADNFYSSGIENYANIQGLSNLAAYDELSMYMKNLSNIRLRSCALYTKYRQLLNETYANNGSLSAAFEQSKKDMFLNSKV